MDPEISGPNWLLCRDIESSVAIGSSVFVAGFCRSLQFSIATCSLSFFLDYVMIDFDNVATKFCSSSFVLIATGMSCVVTQNLLQPASHFLLLLEFVAT